MIFARFLVVIFTGIFERSTGYNSPKYTWPLWGESPLVEIQRNYNGAKTGCSASEGENYVSLNYEGVKFDGSTNSFIDLSVESSSSVSFPDYSFALIFKSNANSGGTLFHYKQDDGSVNPQVPKIREVILWFNETHIAIDTFGPSGQSYGTLMTNAVGLVGSWVSVAVSYDTSKPKIKLITSGSIDIEVATLNSALIGQPGVLRIGATHDGSRTPYVGNAICINMYGSKLNSGDLGSMEAECYTNKWPSMNPGPNSAAACEYLKGYFTIKQKDVAIQSSVSSLDNMATNSRVRCADLCLKTDNCHTFTHNKIAGVCKLFDSDYASEAVASAGTHYYMRRDVCC